MRYTIEGSCSLWCNDPPPTSNLLILLLVSAQEKNGKTIPPSVLLSQLGYEPSSLLHEGNEAAKAMESLVLQATNCAENKQ